MIMSTIQSALDATLTRDDAINQIIASIAMEEIALSHIINTEGEKLQYVLGTLEGAAGSIDATTIDELLALNKSVRETLESASQSQMILKNKLQSALNASTMQGPQGPEGPEGPAGPATIDIDSVEELDPGELPTVENVGQDNQHVKLKFGIPRGTTGAEGKSAYEIAKDNGFIGTETEWLNSLKASSVTVIPFASQQAPYVGANAIGKPTNVALLGFGYLGYNTGFGGEDAHVAISIDASNGSFNLGATGNGNKQVVFSLPFNMKLNSIYLTTGNWEAFSILIPRGTVVFPYVQIYTAAAGTNNFLPLEGATAKPTEGLHPESAQASTMLKAEIKGLDLALDAGTRIAICGMMEITGDSAPRDYYLYFTGGIGLSLS